MNSIIYALVILFFHSKVAGQVISNFDSVQYESKSLQIMSSGTLLPDVVPPSPNTYSLGKFGDIPVSLQNGLPDIAIPLMTLVDKDVNVNVSLSYHASGIKVDEMASWVGLGWTLNAGGMISRVLRGRADMPAGYGYNRTSIDFFNPQTDPNFAAYKQRIRSIVGSAAMGTTDNEPDLFIFNFCGRTGKFFFDQDMKACFTNDQDMQIRFECVSSGVNCGGTKFIITSEQGIEYEFNVSEIGHPSITGGASIAMAWYLTRIKGPAGGEIVFNYHTAGYRFNHYLAERAQYVINQSPNGTFVIPNMLYEPKLDFQTDEIVLANITSGSGSIHFTLNSSKRNDCDQGSSLYALKEISLLDSDQHIVKRVVLKTSYFEASNANKYAGRFNFGHLNYRLRLDSVEEYGSESIMAHPAYQFTYYGNNNPAINDPCNLPYRLSPKQDHWGYYNHSNNSHIFCGGNHLIEIDKWYCMFMPTQIDAFSANIRNGADRSVNQQAVKANSLKSIQYPTGGITRFDMESNVVGSVVTGGLRIKKITSLNNLGDSLLTNYSYSGGLLMQTPEKKYFTGILVHSPPVGESLSESLYDLYTTFGFPRDNIIPGAILVRIMNFPKTVFGLGESTAYSSVTEQQNGNGRTLYSYNLNPDLWMNEPISTDNGLVFLDDLYNSQYLHYMTPFTIEPSLSIDTYTWPYPGAVDLSWDRGQLSSKTVYSENNMPVYSEHYTYYRTLKKATPTYKVVSWSNGNENVFAKSYVVGGWVAPKTKRTVQYKSDGTVAVQSIEEYEYTSPHHKQLTMKKTTAGDGSPYSTQYYYPPDYTQNVGNISTLKTKNMLLPVDIRSYLKSKLVEGRQTNYNNQGQPVNIYFAEPTEDQNDIPFNPGNPFSFSPKVGFTYYSYSNLQTYTPESGIPTTYIWSYNDQYPIAEIKNATYKDVKTALGYTDAQIVDLCKQKVPDVQWISGKLRYYFADKNALITTYTYKPLIGMTSETDPSDRTIFYEYDDFGRLICIKDEEGKILKKYDYHYVQ